ncbi:DUF6233 domain-containing protein [Streptomyces sp. NPDC002530]
MEHQLSIWLGHTRAAIAAAERREAERRRGKERRPPAPDWIVELGIGVGQPPNEVPAGRCHAAGRRRRVVDRDEARGCWPAESGRARTAARTSISGWSSRSPPTQTHRPGKGRCGALRNGGMFTSTNSRAGGLRNET